MDILEKVKDYFNRYKISQEVYENGGILFHNHGAAESYGKTETKKYTRKEVNSLEKKEASEQKQKSDLKKEERRQYFVEFLTSEKEINSLSYNELVEAVNVLKIKTADMKKETLLSALETMRNELKGE